MAFPDDELTFIIEAYLGADPTADPGTWPTPVDLSNRLLDVPVTVTLGRRPGQKTAAAGSCTFWLDNDDGHLTPLHGQSPYYGTWDLGVPVAVDVDNVGSSPPYPQFRGYVVSVEADMVPGAGGQNISAVKVTLGGILRRLGQGAVARSSLRRYYDAATPKPTGYWALDGGQLTTFGAVTIGSGGPFESVAWGTGPAGPGLTELAPWLGPGLQLRTDGVVAQAQLSLPEAPSRTTGEATFLFRPEPDAICAGFLTLTEVADASGFSTVGQVWIVDIEQLADGDRNILLFGLQDGTTFVSATIDTPRTTAPGPHHVRLDLQQSGGNLTWTLYLDGASIGTDTVTATLAQFKYAQLIYTQTSGEIVFGHVAVYGNLTPPSAAAAAIAAGGYTDGGNGYVGEPAHDRLDRVFAQDGIPFSSSAGISQPCGPQPLADVLAIGRDCELVDQGMLTELTSTWGFGYRALSQFYNQAAQLTIDLSTYNTTAGTSGSVLQPVRNDQRIRNEWTVSRSGGGEATAKDEAHQAKRGRYNDSLGVNVATDQYLLNEASWRVKDGTLDVLRQQVIPIDLGANVSTLLPDWLGLELGDRIDRTNHLAQHPSQTVSLRVEGYTSTMRRKSWHVTVVAEPYDLFRNVGVYADAASPGTDPSRHAHPGSTLALSRTTNDTSIPVTNNPAINWGTQDLPYDLNMGGERVTLTAVSGTGASQTLTVTRSVNGVVKAHDAGTSVQIWRPVHYARTP